VHDALLIDTHLATLGALPAITSYSPEGRLEISGKVARQWSHKIAGFLRDDVGAEPGDRLAIDLPATWRAPVWALGAILAGIHPDLEPGAARPDRAPASDWVTDVVATVSDRPETIGPWGGDVLALSLGALAMRWPGELPRGAIDASADVLAQPDSMIEPPSPSDDEPLIAAVTRSGEDAIRVALAAWLAGGSAVLLIDVDDAETERLVDVERARLA
jgi:uncharacterized protein (TIGR03089 family)